MTHLRVLTTAVSLTALAAGAQGRVTAAGPMSTPRVHHTVSRLADGRALAVGGQGTDGLSALSSVEVFTPRTSSWSAAAPLSQGRAHHTATVLTDGRVLVAGGTAPDASGESARFVPLSSAELYDPKTKKWSPVPSMHDARNGHAAALLPDGRVLVVGGMRERRNVLRSVEAFDPATLTWQAMPPLQKPRWQHSLVVRPDGVAWVIGGRVSAGTPSDETEQLVNGTWSVGPPLNEGLSKAPAVLRNGTPVVFGGQAGTSATNYVEALKADGSAWVLEEASLTQALMDHSATVLSGGDVLVIGGETPTSVDSTRVQRWGGTGWCLAGSLLTSRKSHSATQLAGDVVLVAGGLSSGVVEASTEVWKPAPGRCEAPPGQ